MMYFIMDDSIGVSRFNTNGKYLLTLDEHEDRDDDIYSIRAERIGEGSAMNISMDGRNIRMYLASGKMVQLSENEVAKHLLVGKV